MLKKNLTVNERIALGYLVRLCKDVELLLPDPDDKENERLVTNWNTLSLETFDKEDWELCLNALE